MALEPRNQATLRISCSDSIAAMPLMTGLLRLPDLNSCSCLTRYSGCC
ncbi:Uncharacterised protein [Mycobacterium tuberculosis]|nr:Uncharacterised protein [Mycobacterium tuberculosis]